MLLPSRWLRWSLLLLLLFLLLSAALPLASHAQERAEPAGPALNWTRQPGAESCIASVELASRVEARVKRHIFVPAPDAIVAIEGYVRPDAEAHGFIANVSVSDGKGTLYGNRELKSAGDCRGLDEALVLVISVTLRPQDGYLGGIELPENVAQALDALFSSEPSEPDPSAFPVDRSKVQAAADTVASQPPTAATADAGERAAAAPAPPSWGLSLEAAALGRLELQPVASFGPALAARIHTPQAGTLRLQGALSIHTTRDIRDASASMPRSSASFGIALATLDYCTPSLLGGARVELAACAGLSVGRLRVESAGFATSNATRSDTFWSLGIAARAQWTLSDSWSLAAQLGPEAHLTRPYFVYTSASAARATLYRVAAWGAAAELSVAWRIF